MAQRRSSTSTSSNGFPCALVAKLRAVLVAFDLHLVVAFGLLQERIGLLGVGFERGKARILTQNQQVPRIPTIFIVQRSKKLVRLFVPGFHLGVFAFPELTIKILHVG